MSKQKQPSGGVGKAILVFILALVLLFVVSIAVSIVMLILSGQELTDLLAVLSAPQDYMSFQSDLSIYSGCVFALLDILIFGLWYRKRFILPYRHKNTASKRGFSVLTVVTLLLLAFGSLFLSESILNGLGRLLPEMLKSYSTVSDALFTKVSFPPLAILYVIVLGPIAEEVIFRGLIYRFLRLKMPFMAANIFQAVLFGIYHMNLLQGVYAFVIGLIFGFIASRGRGIRYSIVLHVLINMLSVIGTTFVTGITAFIPMPALGISIALIIFTMFVFAFEFMPPKKKQPVPEEYRR